MARTRANVLMLILGQVARKYCNNNDHGRLYGA